MQKDVHNFPNVHAIKLERTRIQLSRCCADADYAVAVRRFLFLAQSRYASPGANYNSLPRAGERLHKIDAAKSLHENGVDNFMIIEAVHGWTKYYE